VHYYTTTIPTPPANSLNSFYIYFTPNHVEYYYNSVLIYIYVDSYAYGLYNVSGRTLYVTGKIGINTGVQYGAGSQMVISAGFSNTYPIYATPTSSPNLTLTSTAITKQLHDNVVDYIYTPHTFPYAYLTCTANFANMYGQFIGLSSTGATGNDYGFKYYTDGNLYISLGGAQTFNLSTPTFPIQLALELSSTNVVFYYNNSIVYATTAASNNYTGVFQPSAANDSIKNIEFGYFKGYGSISLWASWKFSTSAGNWYDETGNIVTNFATATSSYAYLDPTSGTSNSRNNFTLIQPLQNGRMKVPVNGVYIIQWTLDDNGDNSNNYMFISLNDGNADEISSPGNTYTVGNMNNVATTLSISATVKILVSDYFNVGVYINGSNGGLPINALGSFTINYISS
jgi:hypothetical protein